MPTEAPMPKDDPAMIAWNEYKQTNDFANTKKWAAHEQHRVGSLWVAFLTGWTQNTEARHYRNIAHDLGLDPSDGEGVERRVKELVVQQFHVPISMEESK